MKSSEPNRIMQSKEPPNGFQSMRIRDEHNLEAADIRHALSDLHKYQTELEKQKAEFARVTEELQKSRDKYAALYNSVNCYQSTVADISQDAIIAADKELYITNWNKAAETMFGWQSKEVLGKQASSQIRVKVLALLNNAEVMKGISEKGSWAGKTGASKKDGSQINTLVSMGILWDSSGYFNGIVAIHHEVNALEEKKETPLEDEVERRVRERTEELVKANRILQQELGLHKREALFS